jgi:uncharacterized alpha-E superfamily protein
MILDKDINDGKNLFTNLGIDINYNSATEFLKEAIFGNHSANIFECIKSARENAILVRDKMPHRAFMFINELYIDYIDAKDSDEVGMFWLENTLKDIDSIWGNLDLGLIESTPIMFMEVGRFVERIDLNIRFNSFDAIYFDIDRINRIGHILNKKFKKISIQTSSQAKATKQINSIIDSIITG